MLITHHPISATLDLLPLLNESYLFLSEPWISSNLIPKGEDATFPEKAVKAVSHMLIQTYILKPSPTDCH